ncbi:C40 family peptidase [Actinopolymorpha sp. NPDC004070]|uniref:C40 family peptidase n=1 Tax=Actinopolymorpha sp. NPDC004070 TaxID=3154548 RepID=UPI0033B34C28
MSAPDLSVSATSAVRVAATVLWTSPDAHREIDAPIVAAVPDPRGWAAGLDVPARRDLANRVLTQLLAGEPVTVLEERGDWVRVVAPWQPSDLDPRGYPGWVHRAHVAQAAAPTDQEAVVTVEATPVEPDPGTGRDEVPAELTYATILPVLVEATTGGAGGADQAGDAGPGSRVRVALPGGGSGWVDARACVVRPTGAGKPVRTEAVLAQARRFVGLPYLWGGMSAFGLDCSGLVHIAFRALGRIVPRDAHDQADAAERVPASEARPGDLYFFARPGKSIHHVGFAAGPGSDGVLLHAPGTGQQVREEQMDADQRATLLDLAGRLAD